MAIKKPISFPSEKIALYKKLILTLPNIDLKGATMPYTSINGHMFSFLDKDGYLGLRLPNPKRDEFLVKYDTKLCEAHGTILKEYVLIPESLFINSKEMKKHLALSFKYVSSLKPKSSKK